MRILNFLIPMMQGERSAALTLSLVFSFFAEIAVLAAGWKMYEKMGESGWVALIPIYNLYVLIKRCSKMKYFKMAAIFYTLSFIGEIVLAVFANVYGKGSGYYRGFFIVSLVVDIVYLIYNVKIMHHVSRSFGHGVPFTLGLIFLDFIFILILGFGSSIYEGCAGDDGE